MEGIFASTFNQLIKSNYRAYQSNKLKVYQCRYEYLLISSFLHTKKYAEDFIF